MDDYLKNEKAYVWKENFAIGRAKKILPGAFAVIQDKNEITAIIDQTKVDDADFIETKKDYKIITFDMVLSFGLVGFLAKISRALAEENISIFAISAYTTDHILVKKDDLPRAVKKLGQMGLKII